MGTFIRCLAALLIFLAIRSTVSAGTADSPTLSPATSSITLGATGEITFSAVNDKPFALKDYSVKIKYDDGLVVTDLLSSPSAVKAEVYPKRNLIALDWENVAPNMELKAVFKVAGAIGTYTISPWRIIYHDYDHKHFQAACNSATVTVLQTPGAPAITAITVSNITTSTATVSWTTDQSTTCRVDYGPTTAYGSSVTDSMSGTNHSVTLTNLAPAATYHFQVTATNYSGLSFSSNNATFATSNPITINITSPVADETVARPDVTVTGTITNAAGHETGITVNGVAATSYGSTFTASHIPLQEGQNTITATATDVTGNSASASVIINAVTTGNYITLTANTESGISPLETTLKVTGPFAVTGSSISNTGPGPVEIRSSGADEYQVKMTTEGVYDFAVTVTGPDGNIYQDNITLTVLSKTQLDTLLKAKWEEMKNALVNKDVDKALNYFSQESQSLYNQIFTALYEKLPEIANAMQDIQLVTVAVGYLF